MSANPYDPVTTTDSSQLADDDWGLNLPNIRYKQRSYGPSRFHFKGICNFIHERKRTLIIVGCFLVIATILIAIIAVASQKSSGGRKPSSEHLEARWMVPYEGLGFYPRPRDGSTVIEFSPSEKSDSPLIESLNNVTDGYKMMSQQSEAYTECSVNNNPPDKICRLVSHRFGDECHKSSGWGYPSAAPCILLQLNLPVDVTIHPINYSSLLWPVAKELMKNHSDPNYIPVTCMGKTKQDRLMLGLLGFDKKNPNPIHYAPEDGLPSFFYRKRNESLPFIKPAIMIRLTSLKDNHLVHIKCTAWGQMFDYDGKMIDHELLHVSFGVYLNP